MTRGGVFRRGKKKKKGRKKWEKGRQKEGKGKKKRKQGKKCAKKGRKVKKGHFSYDFSSLKNFLRFWQTFDKTFSISDCQNLIIGQS